MPWCWPPSKMARLPHTLVFRSFRGWRRDLVGWLCSVSQHEVSELPSLRRHLIQHPLFCLLIMQPKGVAPQLEIQTGAFLPTPWLYHIITFLGWAGTRPVQQTPHTHPLSLFSVTSGAMRASHGTPGWGWGFVGTQSLESSSIWCVNLKDKWHERRKEGMKEGVEPPSPPKDS